jgi:signal transduction histidine kinase
VRTWPLRVRLTAWYTLTLLAGLVLFWIYMVWMQNRLGLRRIDDELGGVTVSLAETYSRELAEHADAAVAAEESCETATVPGIAVGILDATQTPLAGRWLTFHLPPSWPATSDGDLVWTVRQPPITWRIHAVRNATGSDSLTFVAAKPLTELEYEQREVREAMFVGVPVVLLLAAAGGLWLAAVGLRPVTDMADKATALPLGGVEDLGHVDRRDELGQLARAFNGLVARLRHALETQRQFMADASHELRTPVSVIRSGTDVALSREHRDEDDYRETLAIIGNQARRLSRLVEDMLTLARAEAGGYPLRPVDLYLDEIISECRRAVEVLAQQRGVAIHSNGLPEIQLRGDEDLLRQLILNVLQNSVQHTPAGGSVALDVQREDGVVHIRISDTGPGIAVADQKRIFDRFVQLDPARRGEGTGLGLPIARWIAEAHQGLLVLESSGAHGSTFRITLPASPPAT